ncbi:hypothetical protein [Brevibacillus fulvus]|uniref:Translocation protein TolB n=1 Tax=Brevibacillus fulvus TaxID=1125967 RepID=A0A938Y6R6_9BACL|nr:hypothetical protein [Brevibacillus fulvus]MBM7592285.1 hypothetical protein [Brevibacillus fulvus]
MWRILLPCLLIVCLFQSPIQANSIAEPQVAFVRDGNLWIKQGEREQQLTAQRGISYPQWSHDGKWLAYHKNKELWVYGLASRKHVRIYAQGENFQWSPNQNLLAFQDESILMLADFRKGGPPPVHPVALGIDSFSWTPTGTGFLASSSARLLPDGWTNPLIYQISVNSTPEQPKLTRFYTLPHEVTKGDVTILSIGAGPFKWSADQRWIAFIVSPTASWSADSNLLCLLSADGKTFRPVGEMLRYPDWFKWNPDDAELAFIKGGGRMADSNKQLSIEKVPDGSIHPVSSAKSADGNFTWSSPRQLVVSRFLDRTTAALYIVTVGRQETARLFTHPPAGTRDDYPVYLPQSNQIGWVRTSQNQSTVFLANPDVDTPRPYLSQLDFPDEYYGHRDWRQVLSWRSAAPPTKTKAR